MKFDQVYKLLLDCQTEINQLIVLLAEDTLREIYQCIVATRAKDCLELGTGFGATACVMAAAIDEIGGGTVTTVDHMDRQPVGVAHLARITGMTQYLHPVVIERGYNWFLLQMLRERTNGARCEPCFDYLLPRWRTRMGTGCACGAAAAEIAAAGRLADAGRSQL